MPKFRYVGPATAPVTIPSAGVVTDAEGVVDVDDATAKTLANQPDVWQPATRTTKKEG